MLAAKEREEKIRENLNLVHSIAGRFKGRGIEYDDLFQAGCVGLIKSVDGFDESRGFAFSTYAVPVILGEIKGLFRSGGAIKLSRSMKEKGIRALKEKEHFTSLHGREPTIGELSAILCMSAAETAEVLACNMPVMSLTAEDGEEFDVSVDSHEAKVDENIALKQVRALPVRVTPCSAGRCRQSRQRVRAPVRRRRAQRDRGSGVRSKHPTLSH